MNSETMSARLVYNNLDTSFVNFWSLLRYLSQRNFIGRVHVELKDYTADVFLNGSKTPLVHEVDRASGSDVTEEAALHRLVLRARESAGTISVFQGSGEAVPFEHIDAATRIKSFGEARADNFAPLAALPESMRSASREVAESDDSQTNIKGEIQTEVSNQAESNDAAKLSGELIGAVERAVIADGLDFESLFREIRLALADDYTFLDPMTERLHYRNSTLELVEQLPVNTLVSAITELLRRIVDKFATGERERRRRERVALELARVARKRDDALTRSGFRSQLDHIAGTKVL